MKTISSGFKAGFMLLLVGASMAGCGVEDSTPTAPTVQACETNNTAQVKFQNKSNTNKTYDIIWDGSKVGTVAPGATSSTSTVAAGVQHTLVFKITNTNTEACTPSTPTPAKCTSQTYSCTG